MLASIAYLSRGAVSEGRAGRGRWPGLAGGVRDGVRPQVRRAALRATILGLVPARDACGHSGLG